MGEAAEMMLDGDYCQCCGEYLGEGDGYLRSCAGCEVDDYDDEPKRQREVIEKWFFYNNHATRGNGPALEKFIEAIPYDHITKGKRDKTGRLVMFLHFEGMTVAAVRCDEQFYPSARRQLKDALNG